MTLLPPWPSLLAQTSFNANPDTPNSILAATLAFGALIVVGLIAVVRYLLKRDETREKKYEAKLEERDQKIAELQAEAVTQQAAWVNRERQLGQEMFPVFQQVGRVLEAVQHGMAITVEQARGQPAGPPQVNVDAQTLQRLTDLLTSLEQARRPQ